MLRTREGKTARLELDCQTEPRTRDLGARSRDPFFPILWLKGRRQLSLRNETARIATPSQQFVFWDPDEFLANRKPSPTMLRPRAGYLSDHNRKLTDNLQLLYIWARRMAAVPAPAIARPISRPGRCR
jgi:hypothetical protein